MSTPKFNIGDTFSREGKCRLYICGLHNNGNYLLWKLLRAADHFHMNIPSPMLVDGSVIMLPGERKRLLIKKRPTGYWDWTNPDSIIEMTENELEQLEAEHTVRNMPQEISRQSHPECQARAMRYAPVKAD